MPPRARGGDAAPAAPTTPVRTPGASRQIVHLNSSTPGKKRAVSNGGSASPNSYGIHVKELSSRFIGNRKFGTNMVVTLVYRVDDINNEIVIDELPTCAQAMVKWNGQGTGKVAYNYKLKKEREGVERPTLLHSAFKGMVLVMHGAMCFTRNELSRLQVHSPSITEPTSMRFASKSLMKASALSSRTRLYLARTLRTRTATTCSRT